MSVHTWIYKKLDSIHGEEKEQIKKKLKDQVLFLAYMQYDKEKWVSKMVSMINKPIEYHNKTYDKLHSNGLKILEAIDKENWKFLFNNDWYNPYCLKKINDEYYYELGCDLIFRCRANSECEGGWFVGKTYEEVNSWCLRHSDKVTYDLYRKSNSGWSIDIRIS